MKLLLITLFLLSNGNLWAKECSLDWENIYFQDLVGEKQRDPKTRKREKVFKTFTYFQGHFPKRVSINVPYKGDCDNVEIKEVQSFRNIGLRKFPGDEDDHSKHALFPRDNKWETKPFESIKPEAQIDKEKKVITIKTFKIYEALTSLDFKKYHPWQIRYEIFYKGAQGIDNKATHTVDLKLTH